MIGKVISIVLYVLAAIFILGGIGLITSPSSPATVGGAIVGFGFGALFIILGMISARKEPKTKENLTLIAGKGLFSTWYYIGKEGIYKGKKLFLKWSEIKNIFVIHEYEVTRSNMSLRTLQTGVPTFNGRVYRMGTWRIITVDGKEIDIKNVINPKEMLEYIKNTYLKNNI
ncbi:hypothetical protein [Saccharolobus caldissimus]|uniref:Uncharacterized protein n=1 Tax=Saccharolobus caldissimus TaxID=1702097 RepID=A0AAQ4CNT5_9CREN|nr:hypothetical protein [Saccharolobus caldissimus]BDB97466.1 hypothetical protein SACC_04830 [Saccharolobus caldissimus]